MNFSPLFLVVTFKESSGEFCTVLLAESPNATMCIITDEEPTHLRRPRQNLALRRERFWLTKVVYERMPGQCTIVRNMSNFDFCALVNLLKFYRSTPF
jgi:hypothetical protein